MRDSKFMRGQIWWMEGYEVHKEGGKRRPALIVSSNIINSNLCNDNITVVPLTTKTERAAMRTNVAISRYNKVISVAKCAELVTVYKNQLVAYESTVDDEVMNEIEKAILFALGMVTVGVDLSEKPSEEITTTLVNVGGINEVKTDDILPTLAEEIKVEEKPFDPTTSPITEHDLNYLELMEMDIRQNGKRIVWDAETEAIFMKMYTQYGIEETAKKFNMSFKSATTRAYLLRKKYPEFEKLKSGRKV